MANKKQMLSTKLTAAAEQIRQHGRDGDTVLAHISPEEAKLLKSMGGAGSINPKTGLPEYKKFWKNITAKNIAKAPEKVIEAVKENPLETAALIAAAIVAPQLLTSASFVPEALAVGGGAAELASVGATGAGLTAPQVAGLLGATEAIAPIAATPATEYAALADAFGTTAVPSVPSAFETAINTALGQTPELGAFGSTGTAGFGTALPAASEVAAGLTAAGFAPGTAANLAGETAAGVGATNLLGGATAATPIVAETSPISIQQALQGARLVNSLLTPAQQQTPNLLNRAQEILKTQGSVDYTTLLGLLNQRAQMAGLLGTRYQPQSINLASLLG